MFCLQSFDFPLLPMHWTRLRRLDCVNSTWKTIKLCISQSDKVKCCITSIYYAPTNLRICSYSWDTKVAFSQHYCRCQTASATAQISKHVWCAWSLCSTGLYLLWVIQNQHSKTWIWITLKPLWSDRARQVSPTSSVVQATSKSGRTTPSFPLTT